jgi:Holliday junction resolvase RusA-like endonuclease
MGKQARSTNGGFSYTPKETRNYMAALRILAQEAMQGRAPIEGPVRLSIVALMPVPASWSRKKRTAALDGSLLPNVKPDWDNIGKMCDAFKEVIWRDDKQVCSAQVVKRYSDKPQLCIEVRVA